jgi:dienelactone hydrolase
MAIHGGGWLGPDPKLIAAMERRAERWHHQGWAIMVPEYQAGPAGLEDLLAHYDALRQRYGETPICLYGYSAGAHMALMMALRRPDVRCIVSEAGPTDLTGNPRAAVAFGKANLAAWSPIRFASSIHASVFQVAAANDPIVPVSQARSLAARLRSGTLRILDPGSARFIHSSVDAGQVLKVYDEELSFLARFED